MGKRLKTRCSNKDCKNFLIKGEVAMSKTKSYCQKCYPKFKSNNIHREWTQARYDRWRVKYDLAMKKWRVEGSLKINSNVRHRASKHQKTILEVSI